MSESKSRSRPGIGVIGEMRLRAWGGDPIHALVPKAYAMVRPRGVRGKDILTPSLSPQGAPIWEDGCFPLSFGVVTHFLKAFCSDKFLRTPNVSAESNSTFSAQIWATCGELPQSIKSNFIPQRMLETLCLCIKLQNFTTSKQ